MSSRFSSLRFLAANVSKLAATRNRTAPASNLLLHTSATCKESGGKKSACEKPVKRRVNALAKPRGPYATDAPNVAVVLSGCGDIDGSSILETTSLAIHLHRCGMAPTLFAPDYETGRYYDFQSKRVVKRETLIEDVGRAHEANTFKATRNVQFMAARLLFKYPVQPLRELDSRFKALIIPGGAGVGLILSNFLVAANSGDVDPMLRYKILDYSSKKKPIGTISYAGILVAKMIPGVKITMGRPDSEAKLPQNLIDLATRLGAEHVNKPAEETCEDDVHNVYSAPGLTIRTDPRTSIFDGIGKLVDTLSRKINERDEDVATTSAKTRS